MEGDDESVLYALFSFWRKRGRSEHARHGFQTTIFNEVKTSQYGERHYSCAREGRLESDGTGLHLGMERR
jgi:hypothetical protein